MTALDELPFEDTNNDCLRAVIETPQGSRIKLDYNPDLRALELAAIMPEGSVFPHNFGFFPSTKAADGDPLDVLVLSDAPLPAGCVVPVRLIGAIKAEQEEGEGNWTRNDRLLAVAKTSRTFGKLQSLADMNPEQVEETAAFFGHYNKLKGKGFRVLGRVGPTEARTLLDDAARTPS